MRLVNLLCANCRPRGVSSNRLARCFQNLSAKSDVDVDIVLCGEYTQVRLAVLYNAGTRPSLIIILCCVNV